MKEHSKYMSVTIYESFVDAIDDLEDDSDKGRIYNAIMHYSLYGEEPDLKGSLKSIFKVIKPNIDMSNKRRDARISRESNKEQNRIKTESNQEQTCKEKEEEREKEREEEKEKENDCSYTPPISPVGESAQVRDVNEEQPENLLLISEEPKKDNKQNVVYEEVKSRICKMFNRRLSTKWSDKERKALSDIAKRIDVLSELKYIEELYFSPYPYKRHDIQTFLNNWTTELDRATNIPQTMPGRPDILIRDPKPIDDEDNKMPWED